ncbi:MAG TPA: BON domain-containing protein [Gemmataceae bacterium]|nr:BON domain-containing protein [Gemmataceae bacterium]
MRIRSALGIDCFLPVWGIGVALVLPAAAGAQGTAPSSSTLGSFGGGQNFGGGISGSSGGITGLNGGNTGVTGGGISGLTGGNTGSSGGSQSSGSFRGGFFGQMPNNATGYQGGSGGSSYGLTGGSAGSAGATNAFGRYYFNPQGPGAPNASGSLNFYAPIYSGGLTGSLGGYSNSSGGSGSSGYPSGANNLPGGGYGAGARRPIYAEAVGAGYPPVAPSVAPSAIQQMLARSNGLNPNRDIQVAVKGPAVVLRGTVANEHDRRLAEALVRLSPGVFEVRNELEVPETLPLPTPGP